MKNLEENKEKQLNLGVVIRCYFWEGTWSVLSLIAFIEVLAHLTINIVYEEGFTFPNVLHLICWSAWLCACLIVNIKQKL